MKRLFSALVLIGLFALISLELMPIKAASLNVTNDCTSTNCPGTVRIQWNQLANDANSDHYKVYQNGQPIDNPLAVLCPNSTDYCFYVTPSIASGNYTYKVVAQDSNGKQLASGSTTFNSKGNTSTTPPATTPPATSTGSGLNVGTDVGTFSGSYLTSYITAILKWAIPIVGSLALLMTIYAGYLYMTSQGNPDSINRAKDILIGVITGVLLLFLIGVILNQIGII